MLSLILMVLHESLNEFFIIPNDSHESLIVLMNPKWIFHEFLMVSINNNYRYTNIKMSLSLTNRGQRMIKRGLTFPEKCLCEKYFDPGLEHLNLSSATFDNLETDVLKVNEEIKTPKLVIEPDLTIKYEDDAYYIDSNKAVIIRVNDHNMIKVMPNGVVSIEKDLIVAKDIHAIDGQFCGCIHADNLCLLNNLVATNGSFLEHVLVDGSITTDCLVAHKMVETDLVQSKNCDLNLCSPPNTAVKIGNIQYNVCTSTTVLANPDGIHSDSRRVLNPCEIKATKIFITNNDISLCADESCNGIEIVIHNNNPTQSINVMGSIIIATIQPNMSIRLVYVHCLNKWI